MVKFKKLNDLLGNNEKVINRFLALYYEKVPELMVQLKDQLVNKQYPKASITAHEIKNQSAYLGLEEVVKLASIIEVQAESGKDVQDKSIYIQLLQKVNEALIEIKNTL